MNGQCIKLRNWQCCNFWYQTIISSISLSAEMTGFDIPYTWVKNYNISENIPFFLMYSDGISTVWFDDRDVIPRPKCLTFWSIKNERILVVDICCRHFRKLLRKQSWHCYYWISAILHNLVRNLPSKNIHFTSARLVIKLRKQIAALVNYFADININKDGEPTSKCWRMERKSKS